MADYKVQFVRKRDGRIVPFDQEKITNAIYNAVGVRIDRLPVDQEVIVRELTHA